MWPPGKVARSWSSSSARVSAARTRLPDELDPTHPLVVPVVIYTDGEWVWSGQQLYYAEHHDIPIDPGFVAHARARHFVLGEVPETAVEDALNAIDDLEDALGDTVRVVPTLRAR